MSGLASPGKTAEIIARHGFSFRKKYGQNFLIDASVVEEIVDSATLDPEDQVLEIGPGIGTMTQLLAGKAGHVVAVEIDGALIPILQETLKDYDNVTIVHGDVLKTDLHPYVKEGKGFHVVANLPYYITTPIIMGLLEGDVPVESITIMVQKEVADRIRTGPGSKDYGALSLAVQYYAAVDVVCEAPPQCFMPRPKVSSTVLHLSLYEEPPVKTRDAGWMFRLIRASFNQRRKTLANSLSNDPSLGLSREKVVEALEKMGLDAMTRGEKLTLEQFAALADVLYI